MHNLKLSSKTHYRVHFQRQHSADDENRYTKIPKCTIRAIHILMCDIFQGSFFSSRSFLVLMHLFFIFVGASSFFFSFFVMYECVNVHIRRHSSIYAPRTSYSDERCTRCEMFCILAPLNGKRRKYRMLFGNRIILIMRQIYFWQTHFLKWAQTSPKSQQQPYYSNNNDDNSTILNILSYK